MPLFDFKCDTCDVVFDKIVKNSEEKPQCPKCSSFNCTKLLSAPGSLKFNGKGFYCTDFKGK